MKNNKQTSRENKREQTGLSAVTKCARFSTGIAFHGLVLRESSRKTVRWTALVFIHNHQSTAFCFGYCHLEECAISAYHGTRRWRRWILIFFEWQFKMCVRFFKKRASLKRTALAHNTERFLVTILIIMKNGELTTSSWSRRWRVHCFRYCFHRHCRPRCVDSL